MTRSSIHCLTALALLSTLAACGKSPGTDAASVAAPAVETSSSDGSSAGSSGEKPLVSSAEMVTAVPTGKPGAPVALKFDVAKRPKVGEPLEIQIAVLPEAAVNSLQVVFQAGDGLQIKSGGDLQVRGNPLAGREIMHRIVVTPIREGVFYVTAVVVTEAADSQARTFAIPIVVGNVTAALSIGTASEVDAKGQRVTRLPSKESGATP